MAEEFLDSRCHCALREWQITSDGDRRSRRRMSSSILLNLLLILLLLLPLLCQPVQPVRTINASEKKQRDFMEAIHSPQVTRPIPQHVSSDQNQFNVPAPPSPGRHARPSPPTPGANSRLYNASAHEVPSGPNPISNR